MKSFAFAAAAAAVAAVALGSAASAQNAPKPVARGDYIKTIDGHFANIDANHDGSLSRPELAAEQQRELNQAKERLQQQLQVRFKQLDTNKDGQLSVQEFVAAAPPIRAAETADQMLQTLDSNHDGKISAEEFRAPQLAKFSRLDANHDGTVTPAEMQAAAGKK
jgi:hypothetical protein